MSSSLPNRSILGEDEKYTDTIRSYIIAANDIKNPPKMATTDDGSGTASNPRNIVNNRRRSESFAVYSNQEFFPSSSPHDSHNSFGEAFYTEYPEDSPFYSPDINHLYPHNMNVDKKIVLYKTEMCRTFEETGNCKYGTKCQFAHDPIEIRNIPRHPRYKTEICKTFWQLGNCPYGKRCCFIHTENELRDSRKMTSKSQDIYGSSDLTINEDSVVGEIQSHNTSRSASPSKAAETLKKSISNIGPNSIFNNLSISNLPKMTSITERRRKSIIDDRIEELAMLVGSNCSISSNQSNASDKAAPSSEDPEFKMTCHSNAFELWSRDSPASSSAIENEKTEMNDERQSSGKFALFDKSPGSRNSDLFSAGIWSKTSANGASFLPTSQFYKVEGENVLVMPPVSSNSSGTSSSKSSGNNHQQLLIDMLNLLDSSN